MFLSDAEIVELTGFKSRAKQCQTLKAMGICHVIRPDGKPRIAHAWIDAFMNAQPMKKIINLDAIR